MCQPTALDSHDLVGLAMTIRGRVVIPGNVREYQAEVERVHNAGFWDRKPLFFVLCHDQEDVRLALDFCTRRSLPISIRSGGHSACGSSLRDGTVVIDLSRMRHIVYVSKGSLVTDRVLPTLSCCALFTFSAYFFRVSSHPVYQPIFSR
jgi:hypothetical protein